MPTSNANEAKCPVHPTRTIAAVFRFPAGIQSIFLHRGLTESPVGLSIECKWNPESETASAGITGRLDTEFGPPATSSTDISFLHEWI